MYGLCIAVGIILAIIVVLFRCEQKSLKKDDTLYCSLIAVIGLIIGGKLLYIITIIPQFILDPDYFSGLQSPMSVISGGYVFYGGLIGAFIAIFIYTKIYKINIMNMFDCLIIGVPLAHCFGRIGCFCAGCCYGVPVPWGLTFNNSQIAPHNVPLFPSQLFESSFNLILFFVLFLLSYKKFKPGFFIGLYLICYSVMRFVLEFFRFDSIRGIVFGLSTSQIISIVLLPIGIYLIARKPKNRQVDGSSFN